MARCEDVSYLKDGQFNSQKESLYKQTIVKFNNNKDYAKYTRNSEKNRRNTELERERERKRGRIEEGCG